MSNTTLQPNSYSDEVETEKGIIEVFVHILGEEGFGNGDERRYDINGANSTEEESTVRAVCNEIIAWHEFSGQWPGVGDEVYQITSLVPLRIVYRIFSSNPRAIEYWVRERDLNTDFLSIIK